MVGARHRGVSNLVNNSGVLVRSRVHSEVDVLCHGTGKFLRGKNLTIPGGGVDSGGLIESNVMVWSGLRGVVRIALSSPNERVWDPRVGGKQVYMGVYW